MKRLALPLAILLIAVALWAIDNKITARGPANPLALYTLPGHSRFALTGRIEERLPAGSYVYLRLREAPGRTHWLVTLGAGAPLSDDVAATIYARAESFYSKRLRRSFSPLLFGSVRAAMPSEISTRPERKELP